MASYLPPAICSSLAAAAFLLSLRGCRAKLWRNVTSVLSLLVFLALCAIFYRFTIDDTYISLRYARNLAQGYGLTYSTDGQPPVEGYTNFLWVILETPLFLMGLGDTAIMHAVKLMGIAFGIGTLLYARRLACRAGVSAASGQAALVLASSVPFLAFWAVGGLETSMFIFFAVAAVSTLLAELQEGKPHLLSYFFLCCMALTRPEGLFFTLALTPAVTAVRLLDSSRGPSLFARIRPLLPGVALFGLLYGCYFLWRWHYYGYLLPNTFYAKSGSISLRQIARRLSEMSPLLRHLTPYLVVAVLALPLARTARLRERLVVFLAFLVLFAFAFASKREWMPGFRYVLPCVPFLLVLTVSSLDALYVRVRTPETALRWDLLTSIVLLIACLVFLLPTHEYRGKKRYADDYARCHVALGKWLRQYAPADASYASWDMGAVPYFSHLPTIIEIHEEGLLSTYTTHFGYDVDRFLSLRPSFIVLPERPRNVKKQPNDITAFYTRPLFNAQYQHLFTLALFPNYLLEVYKRLDVPLSPEAISEGRRIGAESLARAW